MQREQGTMKNTKSNTSHASTARLIKKYPNRRLYDTQTSTYITLEDVQHFVLRGEPILVQDAKTDEDLTRSIMLQIILEQEAGGTPMFSSQTLALIIQFYGHAMQGAMGPFLEQSIHSFLDVQNKMQAQSRSFYTGSQPTPDAWAQLMHLQAPMMQGLMGNYVEQSKQVFTQMQEQMQNQSRGMFTGFSSP